MFNCWQLNTQIDGVSVTKQIMHPKYVIAINVLPLDGSRCFAQDYIFSYANKTSHKRDSQATSILDMHQYARRICNNAGEDVSCRLKLHWLWLVVALLHVMWLRKFWRFLLVISRLYWYAFYLIKKILASEAEIVIILIK